MNRLSKKAKAALAVLLILVLGSVGVYAAAAPGGADDPVVTKSYVDTAISRAIDSIPSNQGSGSGGSASYKVVHLQAGDRIIGGEGTEIILRSGDAVAIDNGSNGISDLTSGKELWKGNALVPNHIVMIPRADGRGVQLRSEAYFMIRGEYSVK